MTLRYIDSALQHIMRDYSPAPEARYGELNVKTTSTRKYQKQNTLLGTSTRQFSLIIIIVFTVNMDIDKALNNNRYNIQGHLKYIIFKHRRYLSSLYQYF